MMTPERWQQIKNALGRALELEPAQRSAFLEQASTSDPDLRAEVERLLAAEQRVGKDFLGDTATHAAASERAPANRGARIGQPIGPYRIVCPIGEGGMGTVYRAVRTDDQYEKQVAIKLIQAGHDSAFIVSRFKNERQILASLDHPNIARLLDGGTTDDGSPYFVMELIEGRTVDEYCDHQRLPTNERLRIFVEVCAAVQFAHQRLIIHRDIKPGNILVGADGIPKLLDFGVAKLLDPASGEGATTTVFRALTPGYASPEQIKGEAITTASDVYSLGVVLYELLTGHSPYHVVGSAPHELVRAVCETDPERPSTVVTRTVIVGSGANQTQITPDSTSVVRDGSPEKLRRGLKGDLDNIVLMALRKEPERRYASVEQLAEDIRRHLAHLPVAASKGTVSYRAGKFIARHKAGVTATAVVSLTLIAGIVATVREARVAQGERARAQRRFDDVRKLANSLIFEVHDSIRDLPGSTPARKLIMDRAVQYLDSLEKDSRGDSSLQRDLAVAFQRIGQVQGDPNQGNVGEAGAMVASINKSAALYEEVAKANPNSVADQLNVALAHRMLASISPQSEERHIQIEQALAIVDRLLKSGMSTPAVKSERSVDLTVLASIQDGDGELPTAAATYREALAVRKDVFASDPHHPHGKRWVASIEIQTAAELAQIGLRKEALQLNAEAIAMYEAILGEEKDDSRAARELAYSHYSRGEMLMAAGDYPGALESYRTALKLVKPMAERDPANVMLRGDVDGDLMSTGKALVMMGRVNQGLPLITQASGLLEQQIKADPSDAPVAAAEGYIWEGEALVKSGRLAEAVASDRKAISILEAAAHTARPYPAPVGQLAAPYVKLGDTLARAGNIQDAERAYRKAIESIAPLKTGASPNFGSSYILADAYFGLGELSKKAAERSQSNPAEQLRQWRQARDWYQKSEEGWRHIASPAFVNPEGYSCGSPSRATAASGEAEAAIRRIE